MSQYININSQLDALRMKEFEKTVRFHRKMHGEFFEKEELL